MGPPRSVVPSPLPSSTLFPSVVDTGAVREVCLTPCPPRSPESVVPSVFVSSLLPVVPVLCRHPSERSCCTWRELMMFTCHLPVTPVPWVTTSRLCFTPWVTPTATSALSFGRISRSLPTLTRSTPTSSPRSRCKLICRTKSLGVYHGGICLW